MFHDSHELDNIVPESLDTWEGILGEFLVGSNAGLGSRNSDVRLVNAGRSRLGRAGVLELVRFSSRRVPESSVVYRRDGEILGNALDPCGEPLNALAARDDHRDLKSIASICGAKNSIPNSVDAYLDF